MKKSDLVEQRGKDAKYAGGTVSVIYLVPITDPHGICQSQMKNDVAEMK